MPPRAKRAPAVQQPVETLPSPTPAEVYQAALTAGKTPEEATELSEARAIELAGGAVDETQAQHRMDMRLGNEAALQPYAAGGLLTLNDVPDDPAEASDWLDRVNDLVNQKHPGVGWVARTQVAYDRADPELKQQIDDFLDAPAAAVERWDPEHCPTPETCFPYLTTASDSASCIHGITTSVSAR